MLSLIFVAIELGGGGGDGDCDDNDQNDNGVSGTVMVGDQGHGGCLNLRHHCVLVLHLPD